MSEGGESLLLQSDSRGSTELIAMLEERVAVLVQRHRDAAKTIEELRVRVSEGEAQCAELTAEVASLTGELFARDQMQSELRQRLDRLLELFRKLEPEAPPAPRATGGVASA